MKKRKEAATSEPGGRLNGGEAKAAGRTGRTAGQGEAVDQRRVEEQLLEALERAEPEQDAAADAHQVLADGELPVRLRRVDVAHQLDVVRIAAAQSVLMREADVLERQGIEAHHLRRHRVDRDLIGRRQHHVLDHRVHRARPGAVAGGGAVHDREQPRVDLLLDREQIDQRLVDPRVGVVPPRVEQSAERVLHCAGGGGVDVALGRRQVDDVLAEEVVGDVNALGEDAVEHAHLRLRLVAHPRHVAVLEVVEDGDPVLLENRDVVVEVLALERVGDDGLVLDAAQVAVAGAVQRADRALELPRRRVGPWEREVPGDVVLEDRRLARGERGLDAGQADEAIDVLKNGLGRDADDGDLGHFAILFLTSNF